MFRIVMNFQLCPINLLKLSVIPVSKERVISFHFQSRVMSLNILLSLCFLTYGVLPKRLLVATIIMSVLLMLIVTLLGFTLLSINLMCSLSFFSFKHMLSVSFRIKFFMFNPTGGEYHNLNSFF
jgi:hypothetical protein